MNTSVPESSEAAAQNGNFLDFLSFSSDGIVWQSDWWKVLVLALGVLAVIYLTVRLGLYIARIIGVIICLAGATAGGYVGGRLLGPMLAEKLPESIASGAPFLAGLGCFVIIYLAGMLLLALIRRPARKSEDK
ncbi:MAG: hypothetical protein J6S21_08245 [Victivallales bacterium]|nr:hypothetical protein [Victivallales bacterium]